MAHYLPVRDIYLIFPVPISQNQNLTISNLLSFRQEEEKLPAQAMASGGQTPNMVSV